MSLIKQIIPSGRKFSPASAEVNWTRIETLVHGPGADETKTDYNSAVFACLMAIALAYPEPPLTVYKRQSSGKSLALYDHPLQKLLDKPTPNGELTIEEILFWTAWAKHIDGNAYWLKVRSGDAATGNVVQLFPVSPTRMQPHTEPDSDDWITYYKYRIAPNKTIAVLPSNVIHFRLGLDDQDMRKGLAPFKALVREQATDDEADKFIAALLKNYAVPGLVVIPSGGVTLNDDDAEKIRLKMRQKFGSDNRGNIAVMSKESTIEQFGFSPKDLDMTVLHRIPEERISAVIGVPAIVAGLGAGLDRATYNNAQELIEMFTERKLVPLWRADAARLTQSLLPDFIRNDRGDIYVDFDLSNVRALQEDENEKYARLRIAVGKPWMTVNEARTDIGLNPIEGGDELTQPQPAPFERYDDQEDGDDRPIEEGKSIVGRNIALEYLDLKRWERLCLKRLRKHGTLEGMRPFVSDHISDAARSLIEQQLPACQTDNDVREAFERVSGLEHGGATSVKEGDIAPLVEKLDQAIAAFREHDGNNGR